MISKEDVKKRKARFLWKAAVILLALLLLLGGTFVLAIKKSRASGAREPQQPSRENGSAASYQYEYRYENLEALKFLKGDKQLNAFKTAFESACKSMYYGKFQTVTAQNGIKKEGAADHFYLDLDNADQTVIEGIYDEKEKSYTFGFYKNRGGSALGEAGRNAGSNSKPGADAAKPDGTQSGQPIPGAVKAGKADGQNGQPPIQKEQPNPDTPDGTEGWGGTADCDAPLVLNQEEDLAPYLTEAQLNQLHEELLKYLVSEDEFRRGLTVLAGSIVDSSQSVSFRCTFNSPRYDKKNLTVGFEKDDGRFVFIIE